jgi:hypothetical protein
MPQARDTPFRPLRPLDPARLVGEWHVVATTLPFWRTRRDPVIRYQPLADGRWLDTVEFRDARGGDKRVVGYDTLDVAVPGAFRWRGKGWLAWCASRWCFLDADDADGGGWAVTWFSAATLGVTPEGFDVYARDPGREPRSILERVERAAGLELGAGWFRTHRYGRPGGGEPLR